MKPVMLALTLALATAAGWNASAADLSGAWRVSGRVSSFAFTLDCQFKPSGAQLAGVCVDASTSDARIKSGNSHVLTTGSVVGDRVSWTYRASFLLSKFDVTYSGVLAGPRMTGTITVQGRRGAFTAVKV